MSELLRCEGLAAGHGGAPVVRGLDLTVNAGEIVALLGPNGAGKTTTLLALAGLLERSAGTVEIDGVALRPGLSRRVVRCGLLLVPDNRALFTTLTTRENVALASRRRDGVERAFALFPRLAERAKVAAGVLSGGEQQMLAIARALVQNPKVLMIDELSMGLAPVIVERLLPVLREVADSTGTGVLLVEQHVHLALQTADRAIVLAHGEVVLTAPAAELLADPTRVEAAYLGGAERVSR